MKNTLLIILSTFLYSQTAWSASVEAIMQKALPPLTGDKEVSVVTLEYQPGEVSLPHRHNAYTFVYVLEGSVMMQVEGSEAVTLSVGETFYENPDDIHVVSKNASDSETAKFLVFFIKQPGAPSTVPE